MNDLKLGKPTLINGSYVIFLDSENKFTFKDKRKAEDFVVQVSKELDQAGLFISEMTATLFEFYRLYYVTDRDFKFKSKMKSSLEFLENRLNWFNDRTPGPNWDTLLFSGLVLCFGELSEAFTILMNKAANRKDTLLKRRCALKIRIIEIYMSNMLSLGIKPIRKTAPLALVYRKSG